MGTTIPNAVYSGPRFDDKSLVTTDEVNNGKNTPPPGTVAVVVEPGDNLYDLATARGGDLNGIYANNPQFTGPNARNPDLIYPGEVIFVPDPDAAQTPAKPAVDPVTGGVDTSLAAPGTPLRAGPYTEGYGPYMPDSQVKLKDGGSLQIDSKGYPATGAIPSTCNADGTYTYQNYQDGKAVGAPYNAIPGKDGKPGASSTPRVDTTQAQQGTPIRLGPYTDGYGPYMPNSTVTLKDGGQQRIGSNGYPQNGPLALSTNVDGSRTYQDYVDGKPQGQPYQAIPDAQGRPGTRPAS